MGGRTEAVRLRRNGSQTPNFHQKWTLPQKGNVFLVRNLANLRYVDYNGEASGNAVEGITDSARTSGPR